MSRLMHGLLRHCSGLFSVSLLACVIALHGFTQIPKAPQEERPGRPAFHSLKELRAYIANLRRQNEAKERREKREGKKRVEIRGQDDGDGLDYLESLEAYLAKRAYPNDFVDWDALKGAVQHRDNMTSMFPMSAANWEFLGPSNCASPMQWAFGPGRISGRVASAAIDPTNPQKMYIATSGGGAWKTADGGTTWTQMGDGWNEMQTSCVAVDPLSPNTIYVGTGDWDGWGGYSHGIEKSTDGGSTWTTVGRNEFGNNAVRRILVDPNNSQIVTVVTGRGAAGPGKVWRTTNGGTSWTAVINVNAYWSDIVIGADDGSGNRAYYACASGSASQVWVSNNRGANWTKLTVPMRTGNGNDTADLAASPTAAGTVYLLGTGDRKVWKSTNFGANWTDITGPGLTSANWGQAWYDFYITCSTKGTSDVLYVGLIDILQSWDANSTWRTFMNGYTGSDLAHVDEHDMVVDPSNPSRMLACNDGGVYNVTVSPTTGNGTFTSLNTTLGVTEFYWGDFHPTDSARMIGGSQDNGSPASLGASNWRSVTGGDGGAAMINQTNPNIQYTTYQYFGRSGSNVGFNRTTNNWNSSTWIQTNVGSDRVAWMGPMTMAATDSQIIYMGTNYLWRFNNATGTWTSRLGNQQLSPSSTVASIGVTKANAQVIYTGSGDGQLWVTRNGGTNWTQINTGSVSLPNRAYTAVKARDDNANDVLVGLSGTGVSHLWRCVDTSAASRVWLNVSGTGPTGLPDVPINAIERDPNDPINTWFVGTDIGVFRTTNAGSSWENISEPLGLPNVMISQLWVRNNYLCAVTYGRGMWRLNLDPGGGGGGATMVGLTLDPTAVVGPASSTGTVTISAPAPIGGSVVALTSTNPTIASVPGSVTVIEGQTSATFQVATTTVPSQATATIQASLNNTNASADLIVNPNGLTNIALNPISVIGGTPSTATVTIATAAPAGGTVVQLNSSNTAVAQVPTSVTIPQGQTTVQFTVTTIPTANDATSTIKATLGTSTVSTQLTVLAPVLTTFTLTKNSVVGGNIVQGTVTLNGKAPAGGAIIALSSSSTAIATVPASVTVPANGTTATFNVTTKVVTVDSGVTITAAYHGIERLADLFVTAQRLESLTFTPNPAVGGNIVQGRVNLAGPAIGSVVVSLSSTNTALATVPASVTVPSGQIGANFSITTKSVNAISTVSIVASFGGSIEQEALMLQPLTLANFTLSTNSTFEGQSVIGTVYLNGPALSGGAVVSLTQTNPAAATVPSSVTIPQGQTSKTFTITAKTVAASNFTNITASRGGVSLMQALTVSPITLQSLSLSQVAVTGGVNVSGVVRIAAPAPSGGYVVNLTSSHPNTAKVPAKVTIPQNATSATFTVTTLPVSGTQFVTLTASKGLSIVTTQLQVLPPEVKTFTVSPTSAKGGTNLNGSVTLTGKAPAGGMVVTITSNPNLAQPTATVMVPAGSTSKSFTIRTNTVTTQTSVSISARTLSVIKSVLVTLKP